MLCSRIPSTRFWSFSRLGDTGSLLHQKSLHTTSSISKIRSLPTWDLGPFRHEAFEPQVPRTFPRSRASTPQASSEWFIHDSNPNYSLEQSTGVPAASELNLEFWRQFEDVTVPLELTRMDGENLPLRFERNMLPLRLLLDHSSTTEDSGISGTERWKVYLAQCPLPSLPATLREAVPVPDLVKAGRGDIYDSSLWIGRPPTYTPLHRDPNPNVFLQLAGQKIVRLLPPEVGNLVFQRVQEAVHGEADARFRGDEMMIGEERRVLELGIWGAGNPGDISETVAEIHAVVEKYGQEATLGLGESIFIPRGWFHSIKGVGDGISASVNWWFR